MNVPPGWYQSPTGPGEQWWNGQEWAEQRRLPPWRQRHRALSILISLAGVAILAAVVLGVSLHRNTRTIDSERLDTNIEHWMRTHLGSADPQVECPTGKPAKQGTEFICQASDSTGRAHFDVTVINSNGDLKWQLVG